MRPAGWVVAALALFLASWFVYDGMHALIAGDYVTPSSGPYAGQLGPWSKLVQAIGIEPRSTLMKCIHVGLGVGQLTLIGCFIKGVRWGKTGMLVAGATSLWYLPFGTLLGVLQIGLLLTLQTRATRPES